MTLGKSEVCKYGNYRQAKGESESHGCSHLNPNPRTNKQTSDVTKLQIVPIYFVEVGDF